MQPRFMFIFLVVVLSFWLGGANAMRDADSSVDVDQWLLCIIQHCGQTGLPHSLIRRWSLGAQCGSKKFLIGFNVQLQVVHQFIASSGIKAFM